MGDLFGVEQSDPWENVPEDAPLAERMRPGALDEVVGQEHILGKGRWLRQAIEEDRIPSLVFWGPPGTGKTALARVIARKTKAFFVPFSAVTSGIREVREVMARAKAHRERTGKRTILFVDEIHRFNKAQQDAFLPHVERGDIILIGATTENPSFEVIGPLLSRARVVPFKPLSEEALVSILERALSSEKGLKGTGISAEKDVLGAIAQYASGDARKALGLLEEAARLAGACKKARITREEVREALGARSLLYDKAGEEHYNLISAFHKSLRASDVQASLYWFERMLQAGEDPLYVARRMVRFAVEDIGLADPGALRVALDAKNAFEFLGLPEGKLALAQAVIYLAVAPRSDRAYKALNLVEKEVEEGYAEPVPMHLRNAPTRLMKELGYGKGYMHAHDFDDGIPPMECLPERLKGKVFYSPGPFGLEKRIRQRMEEIRKKRRKKG